MYSFFWLFILSLVNATRLKHIHKHAANLVKRDCTDGSINVDIQVGYQGSKSSYHLSEVMSAARGFQDWLNSSPDLTSHSYFGDVGIGQVVGFIWSGPMILNNGIVNNLAGNLYNDVSDNGIGNLMYAQYCETGDPAKTFGIIFDVNGNTDNIDRAVKNWSEGKCYSNEDSSTTWSNNNICVYSYANRKKGNSESQCGECDYIKVTSGEDISADTGVTSDAIEMYNPNLDFSTLAVGTPVCYSIGTTPDLRVSKNDNGTCYAYYVQSGDTCGTIAANYYPLSTDDIESYNGQTYGWKGCSDLQANSVICVSDGDSPKPVPYEKAECGPLAPGDLYNSECPLNACCDDFGFCGLTAEFCEVKDSSTGAPGTKNCYSNCGLGEIPSGSASSFDRIGYWLDENSNNPMYMETGDIINIDIIVYAFLNITSDFSISVPDDFDNNNFFNNGMRKMVSFGGWDFSTGPDTYTIFRNLALADNATKTQFAYQLANFLQKYNIYGVDFDWEYPGAQDIPGIPADDKNNGQNYLELLEIIQKQLNGDFILTVEIPSSYWYAKNFPLKQMQNVVDYMSVMTYDLYGQWTYGKADTGLICHTDKSKITDTIRMLNKAGLDFSKIRGGIANYARTYQVSSTGCLEGPNCGFTGPQSGAKAGDITNTPGIMSETELNNITDSDIVKTWTNNTANCDFMLYYTDNWAAWSNDSQRDDLSDWFKGIGMSGSSLWALNYQGGNILLDDDGEDDNSEYQYIDVYNCANDLDNDRCIFENKIDEIIKNTTEYINTVTTILNDYNNYISYYDAYIRSYYDSVMDKYEEWFIKQGLDKYFTKMKDSNVVLTPPEDNDGSSNSLISKRDYQNNSFADLIFKNHPNITSFIDYDPINPIKYFRNNNSALMLNNTGLIKRAGITTVTYSDYVITDGNKTAAMKDFYSYSGYNISTYALVQRDKDKDFEIGTIDNYIFHHTTILDSFRMYPNVLKYVTLNNVTDIQNLLDNASNNIGKQNPLDMIVSLESALAFSQIGYIANITYVEGKQQKEKYDKAKKLLVLEIVLGILGVGSIFFDGVITAVIDIAVSVSYLLGVSEIEGSLSASDIGLSIAGIFLPILSNIKLGKSFEQINSIISDNRFKKFTDVDSFPFINELRENLKFSASSCHI